MADAITVAEKIAYFLLISSSLPEHPLIYAIGICIADLYGIYPLIILQELYSPSYSWPTHTGYFTERCVTAHNGICGSTHVFD